MKQSQSSRGTKRLFILFVPLLGIILGIPWFKSHIDRVPVVTIPTPVPLPKPNGYDVYGAAAKLINIGTPPVDPISDPQGNKLTPTQEKQRYSIARREAWLKANARGLQLFQQARKLQCRAPAERDGDISIGRHGPLRELARCKSAEANLYKLRGEWNKATNTGLDVIEMSGRISNGGSLINWLVGLAIHAIGLEYILRDTPAHLTAEEARLAVKRLEQLYPMRNYMLAALEDEKWNSVSNMCKYLTELSASEWRNSRTWGFELGPWQRLQFHVISKQRIIDDTIRLHDHQIAAAQLPFGVPQPPQPKDINILSAQLKLSPAKLSMHLAAAETATGIFLYRLALRAYRVEHGKYPDSLRELVPNYLSRKYTDGMSGHSRPFSYRKADDSYKLWSVGYDGLDDKGVSVPGVRHKNSIRIFSDKKGDTVVGP